MQDRLVDGAAAMHGRAFVLPGGRVATMGAPAHSRLTDRGARSAIGVSGTRAAVAHTLHKPGCYRTGPPHL
jgi:hypothetical protein